MSGSEYHQTRRKNLFGSGSDSESGSCSFKKQTTAPGSPSERGDASPKVHPRSAPKSERQQMALIMQMTAVDSPEGSTTPNNTTTTSTSTIRKTPKGVHKKNEKGETALHIGARRGDVSHINDLLMQGAEVNVKDNAGWSPLHEACNKGNLEVARALLEAGADVNIKGMDDETPLHDAASNGHYELAELLLRHGANPLQTNSAGHSPFDVIKDEKMKSLLKKEIITSNEEDSPENYTASPDSVVDMFPVKDQSAAMSPTQSSESSLENISSTEGEEVTNKRRYVNRKQRETKGKSTRGRKLRMTGEKSEVNSQAETSSPGDSAFPKRQFPLEMDGNDSDRSDIGQGELYIDEDADIAPYSATAKTGSDRKSSTSLSPVTAATSPRDSFKEKFEDDEKQTKPITEEASTRSNRNRPLDNPSETIHKKRESRRRRERTTSEGSEPSSTKTTGRKSLKISVKMDGDTGTVTYPSDDSSVSTSSVGSKPKSTKRQRYKRNAHGQSASVREPIILKFSKMRAASPQPEEKIKSHVVSSEENPAPTTTTATQSTPVTKPVDVLSVMNIDNVPSPSSEKSSGNSSQALGWKKDKPHRVTRTLRSNAHLHPPSPTAPNTEPTTPETNTPNNEEANTAETDEQPPQQEIQHPKRRKLARHHKQSEEFRVPAAESPTVSAIPKEKFVNPIQQFLNLRKSLENQRKDWHVISSKPPPFFNDYYLVKKHYLLYGRPNVSVPQKSPPQIEVHKELQLLFEKHEKERVKMRNSHTVERDRLILMCEQDNLRIHTRYALGQSNSNQQQNPNFCTLLAEKEVYNVPDSTQSDDSKNSVRNRFNSRIFRSWQAELDDKYEKLKEALLTRHRHESVSLHSLQKMQWRLKVQQLQLSEEFIKDSIYVPLIEVSQDFPLLPG